MSEQLFDLEDEPIQPSPWWIRTGKIIVTLIALGGILYLSGGYQYFFFHRTPFGAEQTLVPSKIQAPAITIPVIVHILSGAVGSERTEQDAERLVENANRIWNQANITFALADFLYPEVTNDDLRRFEHDPYGFIANSATEVPGAVNLYLTPTLSGVNGLAYGGTSAIAVADYTSTLDYRTLAHEFGHFLGLPHVANPKSLMSSGATGVELSLEEITQARQVAIR